MINLAGILLKRGVLLISPIKRLIVCDLTPFHTMRRFTVKDGFSLMGHRGGFFSLLGHRGGVGKCIGSDKGLDIRLSPFVNVWVANHQDRSNAVDL